MEKALAKRNSKMEVVPPPVPATTPMTILEQAIAKGVDIDQLEKLMGLVERWKKEEQRKAYLDALSLFQELVPVIKKNKLAKINSQKGNYSYKYSDLGNIGSQIKKAMKDCGLSHRWSINETGGKIKVTCLISHKEGHTEIGAEMEAEKDNTGGKNDIQQKGSTVSYLQRYTLIGSLGLTIEGEDNDGKNHSTTNQPQPEPTEEEILAQWQQSVDGVKSRVELTNLYLKNRKAIDANEKVQAIFKARQEQLPATQKTELP